MRRYYHESQAYHDRCQRRAELASACRPSREKVEEFRALEEPPPPPRPAGPAAVAASAPAALAEVELLYKHSMAA
jgi:hypothetical protein